MNNTATSASASVKLRYIKTPPDLAFPTSLSVQISRKETRDFQTHLLQRLGITPKPWESPIHAWLQAMHAENGLIFRGYAADAIRDAIIADPEAQRFMMLFL